MSQGEESSWVKVTRGDTPGLPPYPYTRERKRGRNGDRERKKRRGKESKRRSEKGTEKVRDIEKRRERTRE